MLAPVGGPLVLRVRGPGRPAQVLKLHGAKCSVGSGPGCTLRLRAAHVLPVQCLIVRGRLRTIVRRWSGDTRLNGADFADAVLRAGDRLAIGPIELDVLRTGSELSDASRGPAAPSPPVPATGGSCSHHTERRLEAEQRRQIDRLKQSTQLNRRRVRQLATRARQLKQRLLTTDKRRQLAEQSQQQAIDRLDVEREQLQAERKQLRAEREQLPAQHQKIRTDQEQLQARTEKVRVEQEQLQAHRQALRAEGERLQTEGEEVRANREKVESDVEKLRADREELESEGKRLEAERGKLDAERAQWQEHLDQLRRELELCREEIAQERAGWQQQQEQWQDELSDQADQLDAQRREIDQQEAELHELREQVGRMRNLGAVDQPGTNEGSADKPDEDVPAEPAARETRPADDTVGPASNATEEASSAADEAPSDLASVLQRMGRADLLRHEDEEKPGDPSLPSPAAGDFADQPESLGERAGGAAPARSTFADATPAENQNEEDDTSVSAYMADLLRRIGSQSDSPSDPDPHHAGSGQGTPDSSEPGGAATRVGQAPWPSDDGATDVAEPERTPPGEAQPVHFTPRARAPEGVAGLTAMRELANVSARTAVDRYARSMAAQTQKSKLLVALVAVAAAAGLFWLWSGQGGRPLWFYAGVVALLTAAVWLAQAAVVTGRLVGGNADHHDGGHREAPEGDAAGPDEPPPDHV